MSVSEKAKELAKEIMNSKEYIRLKEAEDLLSEDDFGSSLLQDLRLFSIEYNKGADEGLDEDSLSSLEEIIRNKQHELMEYTITREFMDAKDSFDALMRSVNNVIVNEIKGCEHQGGCSSCKGCK